MQMLRITTCLKEITVFQKKEVERTIGHVPSTMVRICWRNPKIIFDAASINSNMAAACRVYSI